MILRFKASKRMKDYVGNSWFVLDDQLTPDLDELLASRLLRDFPEFSIAEQPDDTLAENADAGDTIEDGEEAENTLEGAEQAATTLQGPAEANTVQPTKKGNGRSWLRRTH